MTTIKWTPRIAYLEFLRPISQTKECMSTSSLKKLNAINKRQVHEFVQKLSTLAGKGVYEYKFLVNGVWFLDPSKPTVRHQNGITNNILTVGTLLYKALTLALAGRSLFAFFAEPVDAVTKPPQKIQMLFESPLFFAANVLKL